MEKLVPLIADLSYDVRQYSQQLFASVCNHKQVKYLENALETTTDPSELQRLVVRLGETLSPSAIPVLLSCKEAHDDDELDEYIGTALRIILFPEMVTESSLSQPNGTGLARAVEELEPSKYYYRGRPVFAGDVTKELVVAAVVANRERRAVVLVRQAQILSNFSGIECPIKHGQPVSDDDMNKVFSYVDVLAKINWKAGEKYFYRHPIEPENGASKAPVKTGME